MALLLAMYQKMRLIREKNQVTLDLTKYSSKLDRITKNIERVQKRYTSLFSQLDSKAKLMQSNATVMFQNMAGLGTNSVNPYDYTGLNGFTYQVIQNGLTQQGYKYQSGTDSNGKAKYETYRVSQETFQAMWNHYAQNGKFNPVTEKDENGNLIAKTVKSTKVGQEDKDVYEYEGFNALDVEAFLSAKSAAQVQQQQRQMQVQTLTQNYANNVSIWLEAEKARLEAEQDAALEPLQYEETMMELEKEQADAKLQRIKANLDTYTQLVSDEAKNSAPTFGLR